MLDSLKRFAAEHILADDGGRPVEASKPVATGQGTTFSTPATAANNEFLTALRTAIKARNTPYTSFLSQFDRLSMIPDPATRTQAAFATIQGEGRGVRELLQAVDVHLADLESHRMQFAQALERQKTTALGALKTELDGVGPANQAAQQQIESLTQQIAALTQQIGTRQARAVELQASIATEGARFDQQAAQFDAALGIVKSELESQKTVLGTTLK